MKVPDLRMKCHGRTCQDPYNQVKRFAPGVWLCPVHWQVRLDRQREWERRQSMERAELAKQRKQEAREVAKQACGWTYPQQYKLTQRGDLIVEFSGGLPSLGKGQ